MELEKELVKENANEDYLDTFYKLDIPHKSEQETLPTILISSELTLSQHHRNTKRLDKITRLLNLLLQITSLIIQTCTSMKCYLNVNQWSNETIENV